VSWGGGTNLYRHKDAFYFLPDEDEWLKAAFWNATSKTIQDYATKPGDTLHQGDGMSGTGWNYYNEGNVTDPPGPWDVGSGSEELNGTYDMMGNIWEWSESPWLWTGSPWYEPPSAGSDRFLCGGHYNRVSRYCRLFSHYDPSEESNGIGFRVASIPEPSTFALLAIGVFALLAHAHRKRRRC